MKLEKISRSIHAPLTLRYALHPTLPLLPVPQKVLLLYALPAGKLKQGRMRRILNKKQKQDCTRMGVCYS
jgi:hypothetical protein